MRETAEEPSARYYGAIQNRDDMNTSVAPSDVTPNCDIPADTQLLSSISPNASTCATPSGEYLFKYLLLTQVFLYMEAGAVPSLLESFTLSFQLSPQEQGLLGAIVYIAISLTSPFCSAMYEKFSPQSVLSWTLVLSIIAVIAFASTPSTINSNYATAMLILFRACIGCCQAFHCVYSPLWVHDYAPHAKRARWMSYLQAAVPVGITLGYFAGSVTIWSTSWHRRLLSGEVEPSLELCSGIACWRWPFLFQGVVLVPFSFLLFLVPEEHINLKTSPAEALIVMESIMLDHQEEIAQEKSKKRADRTSTNSSTSSEGRQDNVCTWANLAQLLKLRVYVCVVLALSALFFVVSGVQFWTTLYLSTNTNDSMYKIHLAYLVVSGTGPILGVFFGGWCIDQFGGYAGYKQQAIALRICVVLGTFACAAAFAVSFVYNIVLIAIFLWLMLFCGGSILPACSGIVVSAAPCRLRPLASSVAYTSYNLLGYAASNYIPGFIMNFIIQNNAWTPVEGEVHHVDCDTACTYRIGFRIVLWWGLWALVCLIAAAVISNHIVNAAGKDSEKEEDE